MALTLYYCIKHKRCTPNELQVEPVDNFIHVRKKIYQTQKVFFEREKIALDDIDLYAPANLSILPEESLFQRTPERLESFEPLEPVDAVQDVITEDASDKNKKLIHLVVVYRTAAISILAKWPSLLVPEKNSPAKRMRKQKVAFIPPSTVARISVLASIQNDSEDRVLTLNDRPETDVDIAPIILLYEGFGQFPGRTFCPRRVLPVGYHQNCQPDQLGDKICRCDVHILCNEDERCTTALPLLNEIFKTYHFDPSIVVDDIRPSEISGCNACADGCSVSATGACDFVVEFRRDEAEAMLPPKAFRICFAVIGMQLRKMWIMSMWATISFHGLVVLGNHRVVPLTPKLTLTNPNGEPEFRQQVICAFMAAVKVRHRIRDGTETMLREADRLPLLTLEQMRFPNISSVTTAQHGSQARTYFTIKKSLLPSHNRFFCYAKTPEGSDMLVKCTLRYSPELHDVCAERRHAPKLFGFERVPGGWFIVVMELVKSELLCIRETYRSEWKAGLEVVVNQFHDAGMVHCDLRDVNLLKSDTDETEAIILDFDWGGNACEIYYPYANLQADIGLTGMRSLAILSTMIIVR